MKNLRIGGERMKMKIVKEMGVVKREEEEKNIEIGKIDKVMGKVIEVED